MFWWNKYLHSVVMICTIKVVVFHFLHAVTVHSFFTYIYRVLHKYIHSGRRWDSYHIIIFNLLNLHLFMRNCCHEMFTPMVTFPPLSVLTWHTISSSVSSETKISNSIIPSTGVKHSHSNIHPFSYQGTRIHNNMKYSPLLWMKIL